ncbi:unnamed protein product [Vicia faba]|uniref:Uncharacterized protein n=1 Tax=Vicia faba TaxID=3906 RepID=A0AAV1A9K1_VICFA|nr:unnamed protein product [Vicia faba]
MQKFLQRPTCSLPIPILSSSSSHNPVFLHLPTATMSTTTTTTKTPNSNSTLLLKHSSSCYSNPSYLRTSFSPTLTLTPTKTLLNRSLYSNSSLHHSSSHPTTGVHDSSSSSSSSSSTTAFRLNRRNFRKLLNKGIQGVAQLKQLYKDKFFGKSSDHMVEYLQSSVGIIHKNHAESIFHLAIYTYRRRLID